MLKVEFPIRLEQKIPDWDVDEKGERRLKMVYPHA